MISTLLAGSTIAALAYQRRLYLRGVLLEAVKTFHKTVILATHDIDEAAALWKRVAAHGDRPSIVKAIHDVEIEARMPIGARAYPRF